MNRSAFFSVSIESRTGGDFREKEYLDIMIDFHDDQTITDIS